MKSYTMFSILDKNKRITINIINLSNSKYNSKSMKNFYSSKLKIY